MQLNTEPNLPHPDAFYEALIEMHQDLSVADSQMVNAKLILLLGNQIGDMDLLREAMALARKGINAEINPATSPVAGTGSEGRTL
ncbi:DUF2783 domain-containing protein [Burkholderia sp. L27(2015)]|uniref:DUF2783 domain-containing protein n=1 Tax=Burkholderia sp. L27(2015) TaxID=1641858 RepID=UPI00131D9A55|nr:DUF2783 domain-containing protein [Burkholderia sp. L27(2015)]